MSGLPYFAVSSSSIGLVDLSRPTNITHVRAKNSFRLPFWGVAEDDITATVELRGHAPNCLVIVNETPDQPLQIFQPQRPPRKPYTDSGGTLNRFSTPPPGPLLGTLAGKLKSSFLQIYWTGEFHRCWACVGVSSEDWEEATDAETT